MVVPYKQKAHIYKRQNKRVNELDVNIKYYQRLQPEYKKFEAKSIKQIERLLIKYEKEWNESEKEWYNWDVNKLVGWFEYKLRQNNKSSGSGENKNNNSNDNGHLYKLSDICFESICNSMKNKYFRMNHLIGVEEDELKEYGFKNDNICEFLCDESKILCNKYPKPRKKRKNEKEKVGQKKQENKEEEQKANFVVNQEENEAKLGNQHVQVDDEIQDVDVDLCMAGIIFVCKCYQCNVYFVFYRVLFCHEFLI